MDSYEYNNMKNGFTTNVRRSRVPVFLFAGLSILSLVLMVLLYKKHDHAIAVEYELDVVQLQRAECEKKFSMTSKTQQELVEEAERANNELRAEQAKLTELNSEIDQLKIEVEEAKTKSATGAADAKDNYDKMVQKAADLETQLLSANEKLQKCGCTAKSSSLQSAPSATDQSEAVAAKPADQLESVVKPADQSVAVAAQPAQSESVVQADDQSAAVVAQPAHQSESVVKPAEQSQAVAQPANQSGAVAQPESVAQPAGQSAAAVAQSADQLQQDVSNANAQSELTNESEVQPAAVEQSADTAAVASDADDAAVVQQQPAALENQEQQEQQDANPKVGSMEPEKVQAAEDSESEVGVDEAEETAAEFSDQTQENAQADNTEQAREDEAHAESQEQEQVKNPLDTAADNTNVGQQIDEADLGEE